MPSSARVVGRLLADRDDEAGLLQRRVRRLCGRSPSDVRDRRPRRWRRRSSPGRRASTMLAARRGSGPRPRPAGASSSRWTTLPPSSAVARARPAPAGRRARPRRGPRPCSSPCEIEQLDRRAARRSRSRRRLGADHPALGDVVGEAELGLDLEAERPRAARSRPSPIRPLTSGTSTIAGPGADGEDHGRALVDLLAGAAGPARAPCRAAPSFGTGLMSTSRPSLEPLGRGARRPAPITSGTSTCSGRVSAKATSAGDRRHQQGDQDPAPPAPAVALVVVASSVARSAVGVLALGRDGGEGGGVLGPRACRAPSRPRRAP